MIVLNVIVNFGVWNIWMVFLDDIGVSDTNRDNMLLQLQQKCLETFFGLKRIDMTKVLILHHVRIVLTLCCLFCSSDIFFLGKIMVGDLTTFW